MGNDIAGAPDVAAMVAQLERDSFGPCMQALEPKRRAFVVYVMGGKGFAEAARLAGYGHPTSNSNTMARIGYRVSHYQDVIDALIEESRKEVRAVLPQAVTAIREIVNDRFHRDRAKVALNMLERVDPTVTKVSVDHQHHFDPITITLDEIVRLQAAHASKEAIMLALGLESTFELDHYMSLLAKKRSQEPITVEYRELPAPEDKDPDAELLGE
jgi:hypothetical protein